MRTVALRVLGDPAPQGSKRIYNGRVVEVSKKVRPWRDAVGKSVDRAQARDLNIDQPVTVRVSFMLKRPACHYRTGKYAGIVKDTAPLYPVRPPDVDKLIRSTLDALTEHGVIADDSLVVTVHAQKCYANDEEPGALVYVEEVPHG